MKSALANPLLMLFLADVFLVAAVSHGLCQSIILCADKHEECQNYTSFNMLISHLKVTKCSAAEILLYSNALSEVVHFENLSSSLTSITLRGQTNGTISCAGSNTGFYFHRMQNLYLVNVTIQNCGFSSLLNAGDTASNPPYKFSTALYFLECSNVTLEGVVVLDSKGSGVTMLNNRGKASIHHSRFERSRISEDMAPLSSGGNGFYLAISNVNNSRTSFKDCHFLDNVASTSKIYRSVSTQWFGVGGGLYVAIGQNASKNIITLTGCNASRNQAIWGGGLFFQYYKLSLEDNHIYVEHTQITDNHCYLEGGGGVHIGYTVLYNNKIPSCLKNTFRFRCCNFVNNSAEGYGGGTAIYGACSLNSGNSDDLISFDTCTWENNSALEGAAVDITPGTNRVLDKGAFPSVYFADCMFLSNRIRPVLKSIRTDIIVSSSGSGTVIVEGFLVQFNGSTYFGSNTGSALVMDSAVAEILEGSTISFVNNKGRNGGAISLYGRSSIAIHDCATLAFIGNQATFKGGAVFSHSNGVHSYLHSRGCFILYDGATERLKRNIHFIFEGNKALNSFSHDVYASSTLACGIPCPNLPHNNTKTFECIGNLTFSESFNLQTDSEKFIFNDNVGTSILSDIVPGNRYYEIPITVVDEYDQVKEVDYRVVRENRYQQILKSISGQISQSQVQFQGSTNSSDTFIIAEGTVSTLFFNISSSLTCPPGLRMSQGKCVCSAESYFGLAYCNNKGSFLINGFWIGTCPNVENLSLCTSHCPLGFCQYDTENSYVHLLPDKLSDLDAFVCGPKRTGIICGSCRENNSAYYHSYMYACDEENWTCDFGILLYAISELLPLTIMFLIIILLDINFTSGKVNGFIFFAQVLDSISIDANGVIVFPPFLSFLTSFHRFIYRALNFDFFSLEELSFCIWRGATVLDAMAMKFVTIFYAICLLAVVILFMNFWKCSKRANNCLRYRTIKNTVINGLTAYAVICFSQCARISFQILNAAILYGQNLSEVGSVAFRQGNLALFSAEHLSYAIPAIVLLLAMVLLLFSLIFYPFVFKVLAICNLNESMVANVISRLIPIPLMDAFQSSFKDNCRCFAGLYFLYRLFALAAYTYSPTLLVFYTLVQLQLIVILALHAAVQPYKNHRHNLIDTLIFLNLAIINGITLFNYVIVIDSSGLNQKTTVTIALAVQAILIYLPLLCLTLYMAHFIFRKIRGRLMMDMPSDSDLIDSIDLPPLRDHSESFMDETLLTEYVNESNKK